MNFLISFIPAIAFGIFNFADNAHAYPEMGPCHAEVQKLCPGMKPGEGLGKCMKENNSKLSPACQAKVAEKKEQIRATIDACKGDYEQFCKGIPMGDGRIRKCMADNKDKLSAACKASLPQRH